MVRKKKTSWPLGPGRYISTRNISTLSVSTGAAIADVRKALGLGGGVFDEEAAQALRRFQGEHGLDVTGVVTVKDWDVLTAPPRKPRSAAPAGGVDRADEPNATTEGDGQLDPPQGPQ